MTVLDTFSISGISSRRTSLVDTPGGVKDRTRIARPEVRAAKGRLREHVQSGCRTLLTCVLCEPVTVQESSVYKIRVSVFKKSIG